MNYPELTRKDGVIENSTENIKAMLEYLKSEHILSVKHRKLDRIAQLFRSNFLSEEIFRELFGIYKWSKDKPKRQV